MANQKHLDRLRQGAIAWNTWRRKYPDIHPDLHSIHLDGVEIRNTNFFSAYLNAINLSEMDRNAVLNAINLNEMDRNAILSAIDIGEIDHRNAILSAINIGEMDETIANLSNFNLSNADLSNTHLSAVNLSGADLSNASLINANLSAVNLKGANLSNAKLNHATLDYAQLNDANFGGAFLKSASLHRTNLSNANLSHVDLHFADLGDSDLSNTDLRNAIIGWTHFCGLDLRTVKGLTTVHHDGPSYISTSTLECSQGDIPEVFLRGAGLNDTFIAYVRSLVAQPIEHYTCFLSYASKDQDFVERLYADLQSAGVRCWYAYHALKPGDYYRHKIDEAIRSYDKLVLILSQHSIKSEWVEEEVNSALKKEESMDMTQHALFPIRLDDTVMKSNRKWVSSLRYLRHIGDFTQWKDHDAYQIAFQRLLSDIKAKTMERCE